MRFSAGVLLLESRIRFLSRQSIFSYFVPILFYILHVIQNPFKPSNTLAGSIQTIFVGTIVTYTGGRNDFENSFRNRKFRNWVHMPLYLYTVENVRFMCRSTNGKCPQCTNNVQTKRIIKLFISNHYVPKHIEKVF